LPPARLHIDVPQVLVPNTFTWTLHYSNTYPGDPGLLGANAPTIGGSLQGVWFRGPASDWGRAFVEAVPEPGAGTLLSLALVAWWLWRRRRLIA
jgi:hypothetical protein